MSKRKREDDTLDDGNLEKLTAYLETNNLTDLEVFLNRGFGNQIVQSWSYHSQVSYTAEATIPRAL
jgi:hypothetical protein